MKKFLFLSISFVTISFSSLFSQTKVVSGAVRSSVESEGPIAGVSVYVKGTNTGTTTGIDGKYSLSIPQNAATLVFSFIGMKTQEVEISGRNIIDVVMEPAVLGLAEVVVTALGISRER
jgi:hypothetical protein